MNTISFVDGALHFICYQCHQDVNLVGVKPNMLLEDRKSKNDQGKQSMSLIVVVLLCPTFTSCRHFASRIPGGYMKCQAKVHDVLGSIISVNKQGTYQLLRHRCFLLFV
jgi:hypothetical protein